MKNNYWNINVSSKNWMRRIFLPVGNGAFYCENFMLNGVSEPINVVFDCGVISPVYTATRLDNVIDAAFGAHKVIHAVFLSCLQSSHVNGLEYLQNHHQIKIEKIYYPDIANRDKYLMAMGHKLTGQKNTVAWEFCQNQAKVQERLKARLISVPGPTSSSYSPLSTVVIDRAGGASKVENGGLLYCGKEIPLADIAGGKLRGRISNSPFNDWCFCAYNFLFHGLSLQNCGVWLNCHLPKKYSNVQTFMKQSRKSRFNTNLMTVYSGPNSQQTKLMQRMVGANSVGCAPGCLYMDDFDDSSEMACNTLCQAYKHYWEYIGCLQILGETALTSAEKIMFQLGREYEDYFLVSSCEIDKNLLCSSKFYCITYKEQTCLCTVVS